MLENNRIELSNHNYFLGELQSVYRVERGKFETFFIHSIILFLSLFGILTAYTSKDALAIPFCAVLPLSLFCLMVWHTYSTRNDELRIYQHGLPFRAAKNRKLVCGRKLKPIIIVAALRAKLGRLNEEFSRSIWLRKQTARR